MQKDCLANSLQRPNVLTTCSSTRLGLLIFMNQIPFHLGPRKPFKTYPQPVALMQQRGIFVTFRERIKR